MNIRYLPQPSQFVAQQAHFQWMTQSNSLDLRPLLMQLSPLQFFALRNYCDQQQQAMLAQQNQQTQLTQLKVDKPLELPLTPNLDELKKPIPIKAELKIKNTLSIFSVKSVKQTIDEMLEEVLSLCGRQDEVLEKKLDEAQSDATLQSIQTQLIRRYMSQKKSKEEIIKFIMRKAFKYLFKTLQNSSDENISLQKAHKVCIEHYFPNQDSTDMNLLPFRKNSRIKTMNQTFLERVFSSPRFINDYRVFLGEFKTLLETDNQRKFSNTCENIFKIHRDGKINKIQTLRRMPWTKANLDEALRVAHSLLNMQTAMKIIQQSQSINNESFKQIKQFMD